MKVEISGIEGELLPRLIVGIHLVGPVFRIIARPEFNYN